MSDTRPLPLGDAARPAFAEENGYVLGPRIGAGGMGVVHRARDADGRDCALKLLRPEIAHDAAARARLGREVSALQRVRDPHIAEVLDAELDGDEAFVVTQFIDGPTLEDAVQEHGGLHPEVVREIGAVLGGVLQHIHAAGVVHRDLKPSNIMLQEATPAELLEWDPDGTEVFPVVIDFGIAQAAEESRLTSTGLMMGTSAYADPQMLRTGHPTAAADWWGLAATLAFALTSRRPFGSGAADRVLLRAEQGELDVDGAPPQFRAWLRDALRPEPTDRPDPDDLLQRLDDLDLSPDAEVPGAAGLAAAAAGGTAGGPAGGTVPDATEVLPAMGDAAGGDEADGAAPDATEVLPATGDAAGGDEADGAAPDATEVLPATGDAAGGDDTGGAAPDATEVLPASGGEAGGDQAGGAASGTAPDATEVLPAVGPDPTRVMPVAAPPAEQAMSGRSAPPGHWPVQTGTPRAGAPPAGAPQSTAPPQVGAQQVGAQQYGAQPPMQPTGPMPATVPPTRYGGPVPMQPAPLARPPRRPLILLAVHLLLAVLGAVVPVVALGVLLLGDTVARTWERTVIRRHRRHRRRGPRRSDTAAAVAASPWDVLMAALTSVLAVLLPLALGAVTAVLVDVVTRASGTPVADGVLTALVLGVTMLFRWWGPAGTELRYGARRTATGVTAGPAGRTAVTLLLAVLLAAAVLAALARGGDPDLFPLPGADVLDDWAFWR